MEIIICQKLEKAYVLKGIMDRNSRNMVIIPMDHGISDGPIKGLINIADSHQ